MATVLDCVVLSEDVYGNRAFGISGGGIAEKHGWARVHGGSVGSFYACHYRKQGENIIAYRGSEDLGDFTDSNIKMDPKGGQGRVPPAQTKAAVKFCDNVARSIVGEIAVLTGHSLGGALAKIVAQRKNLKAVAFNAPFIGGLNGAVLGCYPKIYNYNNSNDPVSRITKSRGALSVAGLQEHGEELIKLEVPSYESRFLDVFLAKPGVVTALAGVAAVLDQGLENHSIETLRKTMEANVIFRNKRI